MGKFSSKEHLGCKKEWLVKKSKHVDKSKQTSTTNDWAYYLICMLNKIT